MNEKEDFFTIEELSALIDTKVKSLIGGKMDIESLDKLLYDLRELQERLIILKYKIIEKSAEKNVEKNISETIVKDIEIEKPALNFSIEKKATSPIEEPTSEPKTTDSKVVIARETKKEIIVKKQTIAQKIGSNKIESIPSAIKLNTRVGIIKKLFKSDDERYKLEMGNLDNFSDLISAQKHLKSLEDELSWNDEDELYLKLYSLVERRYC